MMNDSKKRKPADKETRNQQSQNVHQLKINGEVNGSQGHKTVD